MLQPALTENATRAKLSDSVSCAWKGGFQSLCALPSNIDAIEAAMRFTEGVHDHVAVFGPSGWGKSHILHAVVDQAVQAGGTRPVLASSLQWASSSQRADTCEVLILDDVQDVLCHPRARHSFRQRLDLRVRTGRKTLLAWSSSEGSRKARTALPSLQHWVLAEIEKPKTSERTQVALQIAGMNSLLISRSIATLMARHLHGNGRSILGAVQRLRLVKSNWMAREDVIPACGVLSPYLLGQNGWDPRDHVFDAVTRVTSGRTCAFTKNEICSYLMLEEMGLSENEVATFLRLAPSAAYNGARSIKVGLSDPQLENTLDACRNAVLSGFGED